MRRGFAAVFIAALILIQVGFFVDNDKLNLQMSTISKDHEQGHENQITLDILLIGNSYTDYNDLNIKLETILDDSGQNSDVESVTGGGMRLSEHSDNANQQTSELNQKLSEGHDYVVLQEQSQVPSFTTSSEFWIESKDAIKDLNERINSEGGETILLMTWGRMEGTNTERNPDYLTMQLHLQQGYEMYLENTTTVEKPVFIAPAGLAFKNIYNQVNVTGIDPSQGENSFSSLYSDGSHPSLDGTYLTSCVLHAVITGDSPVGENFPDGISFERALELQEVAADTVFNNTPEYLYPFEIEEGPGVEFGPDSGSVFAIDPGALINLNVNYSNLAENNDIVNIKINGPDDWLIDWEYSSDSSNGFDFEILSDTTEWTEFSITAPVTENGMPLANSLHQFSMEIKSNNTGSIDWYNFSMKYGYFHGVEIVEGGGTYSISPYDVATIEMTARNLGNTQRDIAVSVRPIDENGSILGDFSQAFALEDWNVFIQDKMEMNSMWPNETGKIRFQIQSPYLITGTIFFEIKVWSTASPEEAVNVTQRVNIVPRSGGNLELNNIDCQFETKPGDSCRTELIVENTGDIPYDFELNIKDTPDWIALEISENVISLDPGQIKNQIYLNATVNEGVLSGEYTEITVELWVDGWSPKTVIFDVTVGDYFSWDLINEDYLHDYNYEERTVNISARWTMENQGNINDGIVVNLDCNIFTDFELELPSEAEEQSSNNPRSFEVLDVEVGDSINFTAWMNISYDEISENMFFVEGPTLLIEARSIRDPRIIFEKSITEERDLFQETIENTNEDGGSKIVEFFRVWQTVIISLVVIIFGSIGVVKAIQYRLEQDRKRLGLPLEEDEQTAGEWMSKFIKKPETKVFVESETIDSSGFKSDFMSKSKQKESIKNNSSSKFDIKIASNSLDKAMTKDALDDIVELADDISIEEEIHPQNSNLNEDAFESRLSKLGKRKNEE